MKLKDLPTWLKGGIIGLCIALILLIFMMLIPGTTHSSTVLKDSISKIAQSFDWVSFILNGGHFCDEMGCLFMIFTIWPSYFGIGTLIGGIVGKVKAKKQEKTSKTN